MAFTVKLPRPLKDKLMTRMALARTTVKNAITQIINDRVLFSDPALAGVMLQDQCLILMAINTAEDGFCGRLK